MSAALQGYFLYIYSLLIYISVLILLLRYISDPKKKIFGTTFLWVGRLGSPCWLKFLHVIAISSFKLVSLAFLYDTYIGLTVSLTTYESVEATANLAGTILVVPVYAWTTNLGKGIVALFQIYDIDWAKWADRFNI